MEISEERQRVREGGEGSKLGVVVAADASSDDDRRGGIIAQRAPETKEQLVKVP